MSYSLESSLRSLPIPVRRLLENVASRTADDGLDHDVWDWYGPTCPCGLPPGDCTLHPRARQSQRPPDGDDWRTWLLLAGRGFGKTRSGAEWVRSLVESGQARRVALVAPTAADARDVMIEGESGLMAVCPPWNHPIYEPSKRRLTWPNGAIATCYSADEPERLRGPQHDAAWVDEIGSWRRPSTFDMLKLGLRLGDRPLLCVTATPRPTILLKGIIAASTTVKTGGSTLDNRPHLAAEFIEEIQARYEGTRLGRQEIHAELLETLEGAWFHQFDPAKHVSVAAEYDPAFPVRLAIDCGTSRYTGAVFFQTKQLDRYRHKVHVFGEYLGVDLYSEANALAIRSLAQTLCGGMLQTVRLDPAATARSSLGPAAFGEYERVFGRVTSYWPQHLVLDGLDQIELLLGGENRAPDLLIHPRCVHLIAAFGNYVRDQRAGEFMSWPLDNNHPHEDMMDALRGGIRDAFPEGRKPQPAFSRANARRVF